MFLSKSDYMLYLSHPAWLWLKKHDKDKLPQIDENTQATFDAGNLFESYAEKLFGDGIRLGFTDYKSYLAMPEQTLEALLGGAHTIFQARFQTGQLTCICDVIKVVGDKTFDLYEIKSSTQAKPEHITDLAFQAHVLRESGFKVRNIAVVHVNNEYVRAGEIKPEDFCVTTDVTEQVNAQNESTKQNIEKALEVLQASELPDLNPVHANPKAFSEWLSIYKQLEPQPNDSIYDLCGLNPKNVAEFQSSGIHLITDIPDDYKLTPKQHKQVIATKLNQQLITEEPIRDLIKSFEYPLYFLDYETLAGVVPPFEGMRPYEQLPFQYSLHIIDSPDSGIRHVEYLHREGTNPCSEVAKSLRSHIGDTGTVISWNMSFEAGCNSTLSDAVPELSDFLQGINDSMKDLMLPFSKLWFVDKHFYGSASIKKVLPVLAPTLSYADLGIHEGASAQRLWMQAVIDGKDTIDKEVLFADLLEYCKLDTLAMVEIYNVLRKI
jgi:hypothetical protein